MTDACRNSRRIWVDGTYRGELIAWALPQFGIVIESVLSKSHQRLQGTVAQPDAQPPDPSPTLSRFRNILKEKLNLSLGSPRKVNYFLLK
jgi:hypothetical protein